VATRSARHHYDGMNSNNYDMDLTLSVVHQYLVLTGYSSTWRSQCTVYNILSRSGGTQSIEGINLDFLAANGSTLG
jgi:hypothetical protein